MYAAAEQLELHVTVEHKNWEQSAPGQHMRRSRLLPCQQIAVHKPDCYCYCCTCLWAHPPSGCCKLTPNCEQASGLHASQPWLGPLMGMSSTGVN